MSSSGGGEEKNYTTVGEDGLQVTRKKTLIEREVSLRQTGAEEFLSHIPVSEEAVSPYLPPTLQNAIFCGHLVTDLDSIAGAIGAAELYGGIPARASEVNPETQFALDLFGATKPAPIEELLVTYPTAGVCLVDHQQTSQLNKAINVDRIVGVIDHHALQNSTIVTDKPIYIDIRPWGSMSSIITHSFLMMRRRPTKSTAGMLLCAILSDTLNLQGPTTTEWDKLMVTVLVEIADVPDNGSVKKDVQFLASQQFKAKSSELAGLTANALCNGDQKVFTFKTATFEGSMGFAVVETTDDDVIMSRASELLIALNEDKESKGLSLLYLAVVNIVALKSNLLVLGPNEMSLALASFPHARQSSEFTVDLGGLVSRKNDYIPAITKAIQAGWTAAVAPSSIKPSKSDFFTLE